MLLGTNKKSDNSYEPKKIALAIAGIYVFVGCMWILLSDRALYLFIEDIQILTKVNMIKGWVYVLVTGMLIFYLVHTALKRIKLMEQELTLSITEQIKVNEELFASREEVKHMAYQDYLTGLPNRLALYEDLTKRIAKEPSCNKALFFIDLDNFKLINDTLGHSTGDKLIINVGKRLAKLIPEEEVIYRLGGDEFIICSYNYRDLQELEERLKHLLAQLVEPFQLEDIYVHTTVSIGIAIYPQHGENVDDLLKMADIAMYNAKSTGKNRYTIYHSSMFETVTERMLMEKNLRPALSNNEFLVYYQPQIDAETKEITGFEALLRWQNAELGAVSPLRFIPVAEDTHLIIPIGTWVLRTACSFIKKLESMGHGRLSVSVNISLHQLLQDDFVETVFKAIAEADIEPQQLELEITETIIMESLETITTKLVQLRDRGIKIALDDFGKGYSSLNELQNLPLDTLKIDKLFIDKIRDDNLEGSLVDTIIAIGLRMGLTVLAEGVEQKGQYEYLKRYKCHKIQGYYFSKPLPKEEVIHLLSSEHYPIYQQT